MTNTWPGSAMRSKEHLPFAEKVTVSAHNLLVSGRSIWGLLTRSLRNEGACRPQPTAISWWPGSGVAGIVPAIAKIRQHIAKGVNGRHQAFVYLFAVHPE